MAVRIRCPVCGDSFARADNSGGNKAKCPNCDHVFAAPNTSTILEPPAAVAPATACAVRTPTILEPKTSAPPDLPPTSARAPAAAKPPGPKVISQAGVPATPSTFWNKIWLIPAAAGGVIGLALLIWIGMPKTAEKEATSDSAAPTITAPAADKVAMVKPDVGAGQKKITVNPVTVNPASAGDPVQALIKKLDNAKERLDAVQALGEMGGRAKGAIHKLIPLWKKQDDLGRAVERALDKIGTPDNKSDYEMAVDCLKDPNPKMRIYAAAIIKKMVRTIPEETVPKTIDALHRVLMKEPKEPEVSVRQHAVSVLPELGKGYYRGKVLPALLHAVGDDDPVVSGKAMDGLTALGIDGEKDFDAVKRIVKHSSWEVRWFALDVLGKGKVHAECTEILLEAMKSPAGSKDDETKILKCREKAMEGLAKAEAKVVFPVLIDALHDEHKKIQAAALASLQKLDAPPGSTARLVKCLSHDRMAVRLYAVASFQKTAGLRPEDVSRLANCLNDSEPEVARLTATTLGKLGQAAKSVAPLLQKIAANKEADKELRRQALGALGAIGRAEGSVEIAFSVVDNEPDLAPMALAALDKFAPFSKTEIDRIGTLIKSKQSEVRSFSARKLGTVTADPKKASGNPAIKLLTEALKAEQQSEVRRAIVMALGAIGADAKSALPTLTDTLKKLQSENKIWEQPMQIQNQYVKAVQDYQRQAGKPFFDKNAALISINFVKQKFEAAFLTVGKIEYEDVGAIVDTLARIGSAASPSCINLLQTNINPHVRMAAAKALGEIGADDRAVIQALQICMSNDAFPDVQAAARAALFTINAKMKK